MRSLPFKMMLAVAAVVVLWLFVGIERIAGDHEIGVSSRLFIKHQPSLQFHFSNPAEIGLDIIPIEELSASEQVAFKHYCELRFGESEPAKCYARLTDRRV